MVLSIRQVFCGVYKFLEIGNRLGLSLVMTGKIMTQKTSCRAGLRAEFWAAVLLCLKGYRIVARRWRWRGGEIDIVAKRGAHLVFVEVKRRKTEETFGISVLQRKRLLGAARAFLARYPHIDPHTGTLRFDAILCLPWRLPRHIPDAWREEEL